MNIAIIPARGGSKRIPHKNIKDFCGRPILSYSIESALNSKLFDEVMVSTDDEGIAQIAREYGASVPFLRSKKASDDYATTADVLLEVLRNYRIQHKDFSFLCCIYPTAPFVTAGKLCRAMDLIKTGDADALLPITQFSYPPLRGLILDNGYLKMKWPEYVVTRSQDMEPLYHDAGQFYLLRTSAFLSEKVLYLKKTVPMFLSETEVQDIDNESDWHLAEIKYRLLKNE